MRVIGLKPLREFWDRHDGAETPLRLWYKTVKNAAWSSLRDVRRTYPQADGVKTEGGEVLAVFNIGGNKFRLIARIRYDYELINVRGVVTHREIRRRQMEEVAMHTTVKPSRDKLPGRYGDLVRAMPPQAITDDAHLEATVGMIDRLMASGRLTKDQRLYLETLVQLVQAYADRHHGIDTDDISGIDALRRLLSDNGMGASDLGRLLGMHASMGSKILKGERSLTVEHLRKLADRFKVRAELFMA